MNNQRVIFAVIAIAAATTLGYFAGKRRSPDAAIMSTPVVRTYMVQPEYIEDMRYQLNTLFGDKDVGRAQGFNNGLLVVRAPEAYQWGVQKMVDQLATQKPAAKSVIQIEYWLVTAHADKSSNAGDFPFLKEPLESIAKVEGSRKFKVLEHLRTNSMSGQEVVIEGAMMKALATPSLNGGIVAVATDISTRLGKVKARTQITPGEFLVLGQNAIEGGNVYYIIKAEVTK